MPEIPEFLLNPGGRRSGGAPSASAAAAPFRALEGVGDKVVKLAQKAIDNDVEMLQHADEGHILDVKLRMISDKENHELFKIENIDETLWSDDMKERVDSTNSFASSVEMLTPNRERLDRLTESWSASESLDTFKAAKVQSLRRNEVSANELLKKLMEKGDIEGALDHIENMNHLHSEEKDVLADKKTEEHIQNDLRQLAYDDPQFILDGIKGKTTEIHRVFSKSDIRTLKGVATNSLNKLKGEEAVRIAEMVEGDQLTEEQTLAEIEASEHLDADDRRKLAKVFKSKSALTDDEFVNYDERLNDLSFWRSRMSPEDYEKEYWSLVHELSFLGNRSGAERLRRRLGGMSSTNLDALDANRNQTRNEKLMEFASDALKDKKEEMGKTKRGPEGLNTHRRRVLETVDRWLNTHPRSDSLDSIDVEERAKFLWEEGLKNPEALDSVFGPISKAPQVGGLPAEDESGEPISASLLTDYGVPPAVGASGYVRDGAFTAAQLREMRK